MSVGLYLQLQISGENNESLTLADGNATNATPYQITALDVGDAGVYVPMVAASTLPYTTTVMSLVVDITGASQNAVLASLATLQRIMARVDMVAAGYELGQVIVKYSPPGSTLTSASNANIALVLGAAGGTYVNPGADWVHAGSSWTLKGVTLAFRRVAVWHVPQFAASYSGITWQQNGQTTIAPTFSGQGAPTFPSTFTILFTANSAIDQPDMYIATTTVAERVRVVDANSFTSQFPGSTFTSTADAQARGGNVLSCAPPSGGVPHIVNYNLTWSTPRRAYDVYCIARGTGSNTFGTLQVAPSNGGGEIGEYTSPVTIVGDNSGAGIYYLGRITSNKTTASVPTTGFAVWFRRADSAVAVTLEVDSYLLVAADDSFTSVRRVYRSGGSFLASLPTTVYVAGEPSEIDGVGAGTSQAATMSITGSAVVPYTGSSVFVTTYGRGTSGSKWQFAMSAPLTVSGTAYYMTPTAL